MFILSSCHPGARYYIRKRNPWSEHGPGQPFLGDPSWAALWDKIFRGPFQVQSFSDSVALAVGWSIKRQWKSCSFFFFFFNSQNRRKVSLHVVSTSTSTTLKNMLNVYVNLNLVCGFFFPSSLPPCMEKGSSTFKVDQQNDSWWSMMGHWKNR